MIIKFIDFITAKGPLISLVYLDTKSIHQNSEENALCRDRIFFMPI